MKLNEKLEDELDKQFKKGDKARGRALVLFAIAQIELDKKDKEIEGLKYKIEELEDEFNIVSGKDAERFIQNMEREEKGDLSKKDKIRIKRFEEMMKLSHSKLKAKEKNGTK